MNMGLEQVYDTDGISRHFTTPENEDRDGPRNIGFLPFKLFTLLVAREDFIKQLFMPDVY
jgi:hypothetical protein